MNRKEGYSPYSCGASAADCRGLATARAFGAAVGDVAVLYGTLGPGGTTGTLLAVDTKTGTLSPAVAVGYAVSGTVCFHGVLSGVTMRNDPALMV